MSQDSHYLEGEKDKFSISVTTKVSVLIIFYFNPHINSISSIMWVLIPFYIQKLHWIF